MVGDGEVEGLWGEFLERRNGWEGLYGVVAVKNTGGGGCGGGSGGGGGA